MNDLISVIIPVYNVGEYLQTCIDSVRKQTYKDLQIILVDDGSTDGSGQMCEDAALKDKRITVIHQRNGGLSAARNSGMEAAIGKYICFLDSDDWFDKSFVEKLYTIAEDREADVAVCTYFRVKDETESIGDLQNAVTVTEYDNIQAVSELIKERKISSVVWNKLYRRSLWESVRFPVGRIHEDEFITYRVLWEASKIAETDEILYYYRQRTDSIMEAADGEALRKRAFDAIDACEERYLFFKTTDRRIAGIALVSYLDYLKYTVRSGLISARDDKKEVFRKYNSSVSNIWKVKGVSLYKRMALTIWTILIRII